MMVGELRASYGALNKWLFLSLPHDQLAPAQEHGWVVGGGIKIPGSPLYSAGTLAVCMASHFLTSAPRVPYPGPHCTVDSGFGIVESGQSLAFDLCQVWSLAAGLEAAVGRW